MSQTLGMNVLNVQYIFLFQYTAVFTLSEKPDTFELRYLNYGQFALVRRGISAS